MRNHASIFAAMLCLILLMACGDDNSTVNGVPLRERGDIVIMVGEQWGGGFSGYEISTLPETAKVVTDSAGVARISDLDWGTYGVFASKEGLPSFQSTIVLASEERTVRFTLYPEMKVYVRDDRGLPCAGATVSFDSAYGEKTTDDEGCAIFENVPGNRYRFTVRWDPYDDHVALMNASGTVELRVTTHKPEVRILAPEDSAKYLSPAGIVLRGEGFDTEDGELTGESLAWYSSLDNLLGYGKELTVTLTKGQHSIRLVGVDSDKKQGEASVLASVYVYNLDSFFPTPAGETWDYRFLNPEFYVTTAEGDAEYWVMKEMTARFDTDDKRTITLLYDIARDKKISHCSYTVTDHLSVKDGSVSIFRTEEAVREWEFAEPYLAMEITTSYTPYLLMLKNIDDIAAERSYSAKSDIKTTWWYNYYEKTSMTFQEWRPMYVDYEIEAEETVQTGRGPVRAYPVRMRERDGFERVWHLARGIGIIRIADNAFAPETVAVLRDASILHFSKPDSVPAGRSVFGASPPPPTLDFRIDRKTGKNMRRLAGYLAGLCPR